MAEAHETRLHLVLLILGVLFFLTHIAARYYLVLLLLPQGAVTPAMVSVRDSILQMGITVSAASLILPSAGFQRDEERIVLYLLSLTAILFTLGLYLNSLKSPIGLYLVYNSGAILTILSAAIVLGYLGFRGRRLRTEETDRTAMFVLALILVLNMVTALWMFSIVSSGRMVSPNFDVLRDHSMRYMAWTVLAAFIMKFSNPSERLYRQIILVLVTASTVWTLTFGVYTLGVPIQIVSGVMDVVLEVAFLATVLSLWGLMGKRGRVTPHFTLGSIALVWLLIAGAAGLYMTTFYSAQGLVVPSGWRVFHLMNANWSLIAGLGALALASTRYSGRLGWIVTLLFSAGMVKTITTYLVNVFDQSAATVLLTVGEPFMMLGFLVVVYLLFRAERHGAT
ncbi:MAG: hypothetical protein ACE5KU_01785 [Nitrososphaerales archaeon]